MNQTPASNALPSTPTLGRLSLGCPVWAASSWVGHFYTTTNRRQWLSEYSSVFTTVEGNSTFYALPTLETTARWAAEVSEGFEFALKLPRRITHEHQLVGAERDCEAFLQRLEILDQAGRLGPSFMQLPPTFSGAQFPSLQRFLDAWPTQFPLAVEVRHPDFFDEGPCEQALDAELQRHTMDRVLFDSRCLFSQPPEDEAEQSSQSRKPRSPLRTCVTGQRPLVRFVGRNRIETAQPWIDQWADLVSRWLQQGLSPLVFTHAPDDRFAPQFARRFHQAVAQRLPQLPPLAPPPVEQGPQQLTLF